MCVKIKWKMIGVKILYPEIESNTGIYNLVEIYFEIYDYLMTIYLGEKFTRYIFQIKNEKCNRYVMDSRYPNEVKQYLSTNKLPEITLSNIETSISEFNLNAFKMNNPSEYGILFEGYFEKDNVDIQTKNVLDQTICFLDFFHISEKEVKYFQNKIK